MSIYSSAPGKMTEDSTDLKLSERINIGQLLIQLHFASLQSLMLIGRSILSFLDLLLDNPQITLASFQISAYNTQFLLDLLEFLGITVNSLPELFDIVLGFCLSDFGFRDGIIGEIE